MDGRIEKLGQLSVGWTAVGDLHENAPFWSFGTLAYHMLHGIRTLALSGPWRTAIPRRRRRTTRNDSPAP